MTDTTTHPTHRRPNSVGNQRAAKPADERIAGKGRTVVDLGPLKPRIKAAADGSITDWIRTACAEKLDRDS